MNGHERALVGQVSLRKMGTSGRVRKGSPHEGGFPIRQLELVLVNAGRLNWPIVMPGHLTLTECEFCRRVHRLDQLNRH
jgi:hypothetical protein